MRIFRYGLFAAITVSVSCSLVAHAQELTEAKCRAVHEELRPPADEPWRTIPWKIGLLDAQRTAAKEGKPIFIWAMDGHPLGCT